MSGFLLTMQHGEVAMDVIDRIDDSFKVTETQRETVRIKERGSRFVEGDYNHFFNAINSAAAIYRVENDGRDFIFVDFNKAAEQIDNISRSQVIGRNIVDVFPKTLDCGLIDVFARVFKTGKPESFYLKLLKDGAVSGWRKNNVYKLSDGKIAATYHTDTQRKQMVRLSIEHRQKLRELTSELSLSEERQRRKIVSAIVHHFR